jgi:hypothetical protein
MKEVDLNTVSQKKVISLSDQDFVAAYNPTTNELKIDPNAGSTNQNSEKRVSSKTVWNILNMLGAHEYLGHKVIGWGDKTNTHYLVYLFQKRHRTWKKTTEDFKELMEDNLNDYIKTNRAFERGNYDFKSMKSHNPDDATIRSDSRILRENDFWPDRDLSGQDSIRFFNRIIERFPENAKKIKNPFKK